MIFFSFGSFISAASPLLISKYCLLISSLFFITSFFSFFKFSIILFFSFNSFSFFLFHYFDNHSFLEFLLLYQYMLFLLISSLASSNLFLVSYNSFLVPFNVEYN